MEARVRRGSRRQRRCRDGSRDFVQASAQLRQLHAHDGRLVWRRVERRRVVGSQFEFGAFQHDQRLYGRSKLRSAPRRHGLDPIGGCPREFGVLSLRLRAAGVLTTALDCCNRPDGGVLQPSCRVVENLCAPFGAALVCRRECLLAHGGAATDDPRGRNEYGLGDSNAASRLEPPCVLPDPRRALWQPGLPSLAGATRTWSRCLCRCACKSPIAQTAMSPRSRSAWMPPSRTSSPCRAG